MHLCHFGVQLTGETIFVVKTSAFTFDCSHSLWNCVVKIVEKTVNTMNTTEFSRRLNCNGRAVIFCYEKFKSNFETIKNEASSTSTTSSTDSSNGLTGNQWHQLDTQMEALGSAVKDLKRSIEIANHPRYAIQSSIINQITNENTFQVKIYWLM